MEKSFHEKCRISGKRLKTIMDFGKQPLGNAFVSKEDFKKEYFYQMRVGFNNESKMFQLIKQPNPTKIFHENYAFFSSSSKNMAIHFKEFAKSILDSSYLQKDPFIIELGSNDGILLKHIKRRGVRHLGIEPSKNVANESRKLGINAITEFFNQRIAREVLEKYGPSDTIVAANVMCHIPNISEVIKGIKLLLKPSGVMIFEDPYLGDVIEKNSYDQIYDEHVFLFSGLSIKHLFNLYDLELINVLKQNTHGGSMRYIIANKNHYPINPNVDILINQELSLGLNDYNKFKAFSRNVKKSKNDLIDLLVNLKMKGKKVAGYAATSKSTTTLNYCNINSDLVEYITDTTPIKQNRFSPGMHIPVYDYKYFEQNPPDYAILFAWNHMNEIMEKEKKFSKLGGKWITHIPKVRIL